MKVTAKKKVWLPREGLAFKAGETKEVDEKHRERIASEPNLFTIEKEPKTAPAQKKKGGKTLAVEPEAESDGVRVEAPNQVSEGSSNQ